MSLCAADPTCFYLLLLFQPRGVFFIHGLCQAARHPPSGSQRTTETDGVYFRIYAGGGENIPDLSHLISSHLSLSYIHMYIYICTCMYKYSYPVRRKKTLPGWLAVPGFHLFYDDWHSPQFWMLIRALLMFRAAPSSRFPSCSNWARPTIAFAIR